MSGSRKAIWAVVGAVVVVSTIAGAGGLTKRGDVYLRTLLVHGARAVLTAARLKQRRGQPLDPLQAWALKVQDARGHNKAACALANKLARIAWAALRKGATFERGYPVAA